MPTYNSDRYLAAAIESILGQTFQDFEIVVVDDGSTDETQQKVVPFGHRVRYVRQENCGVGATRNRALALATGELVAFLDADDIWEPEHLEVKVRTLDRYPALGAAFGEFSLIDADGRLLTREGTVAQYKVFERHRMRVADAFAERGSVVAAGRTFDVMMGSIFEILFLGNFVLPTSLVLRRTLALANGPFLALRTQEDYEYMLRFARRHPLGFVPAALVRYRRHPEQLTSFERLTGILVAAGQIVDQYEEEFRRLGRSAVFDRRKAGLCATLASVYLRQGRVVDARRCIAETIARAPWNWRGYASYVLSAMPPRVLARLLNRRGG